VTFVYVCDVFVCDVFHTSCYFITCVTYFIRLCDILHVCDVFVCDVFHLHLCVTYFIENVCDAFVRDVFHFRTLDMTYSYTSFICVIYERFIVCGIGEIYSLLPYITRMNTSRLMFENEIWRTQMRHVSRVSHV